MEIAILGGGVIGVATAIAVKRALAQSRVTIYSELLTPETTGDGSAGLCMPYILGDTPESDVMRWAGETHRWAEGFWRDGLAAETGISLVAVTRVSREKRFSMPFWARLVYGAVELTEEQLGRLGEEHATVYNGGMHFVTYTVEPSRLLPWLMNKFASDGGIIRNKKINSFDELAKDGYDTVINCSGLGARELADDSSLIPVRGQVMRVRAPWALSVFIEEDHPGNYIIPNCDSVVLGGTATPNDFNTVCQESDGKFIRQGCTKIRPALEDCKVVGEWAGLRPSRSRVRLEREYRSTPNGNKYQVIHNYGHGGAGVTVCWGCALDVVRILEDSIRQNHRFSSKL